MASETLYLPQKDPAASRWASMFILEAEEPLIGHGLELGFCGSILSGLSRLPCISICRVRVNVISSTC
jgi:hypothetical protein